MQVKNSFLSKIDVVSIIRYTIFITNIIAVIFLLLATLAWEVPPSKFPPIAYLGLGFPILLFINIGYLLLWVIFMRWKFVLLQLVFLSFCWKPIIVTFPLHRTTKEIPERHFKVLSYNVRGFNWLRGQEALENPIIQYVVNSGADIVCFQEFTVASKTGKNSIISVQELNKIMKDYPYHAVVKIGNMKTDNLYGLACYSKFPIERSMKIPIESKYNGSAIFEINIHGKVVSLISNHLESNRLTSEDKKIYKDFFKTRDKESFDEMSSVITQKLSTAYDIREQQVNTIRQYIDKEADRTKATIVCGDFNDTPLSYAYHTIKGDLIDSFAHTGKGLGITYHENLFFVRIDYIMHSIGLESYNTTVGKVKYSDHYPVWTYLKFK